MKLSSLSKYIGVALLAGSLGACSVFHGSGVKNTASNYDTKTNPNPLVKVSQGVGGNELKIYLGNTYPHKVAKKGKKGSSSVAETVVKSGDINYYTNSSVVLGRNDVQRAFVAKTATGDLPALALRLKPASVRRLTLGRKGYSHILGELNGSVFSVVDGERAELTDGVLLLPMPSLVTARDAADMIRQ